MGWSLGKIVLSSKRSSWNAIARPVTSKRGKHSPRSQLPPGPATIRPLAVGEPERGTWRRPGWWPPSVGGQASRRLSTQISHLLPECPEPCPVQGRPPSRLLLWECRADREPPFFSIIARKPFPRGLREPHGND